MSEKGWTYRKAGVDVEAGDRAARAIKKMAATTFAGHDIQTPGAGYSGVYRQENGQLLLATCDGVGSKLILARKMNNHRTIGIDLVAMSINDLLAQGGQPLFFLDYLALGRLSEQLVEEVLAGIVEGCRTAGCALLGGETAEMPDFYEPGEYDLAGFAVGTAREEELLPRPDIAPGDLLLGLPSSGVHSNGFTLLRKVLLQGAGMSLDDIPAGWEITLGQELLRPTTIYSAPLQALQAEFRVKGLAHITGGGLRGNIPRIVPPGLIGDIWSDQLPSRPIFELIKEKGGISTVEMEKTFNLGMGMVAALEPGAAEEARDMLNERFYSSGYQALLIGAIKDGG